MVAVALPSASMAPRVKLLPKGFSALASMSGLPKKVQFIVTVLHKPELLIFDEPFSGFDPINAAVLKREILELRDKGTTIIFSTHNMGSVEELCDCITLINRSRNILSGGLHSIRAGPP